MLNNQAESEYVTFMLPFNEKIQMKGLLSFKLKLNRTDSCCFSALAIIFNIPNVPRINVTATSIAGIFMGKISYWNDLLIQSVNPSVTLPNEEILLVARSDTGAGDTLILTSALSALSDMWNKSYGTFMDPDFVGGDCCNSTKWPSHLAFYGNRVSGMIGVVASIPYTLGYVSWPNTLGTGVTVATVINAYGTLVEPNSTESVSSAMDYFLNISTRDSSDGLEYEINNAKSEHAYPFGSFSYMILNRTTHPNVTSCQMQELTGFVAWLFSPVVSSQVSKYGLIPLSSKVTDFIIKSVLPRITYQGNSVYTEFQLSLAHPDTTFKFSINMVIIGCVTLVTIAAVTTAIFVSYYRKMKLNDTLWILNGIKIVGQDDFLRSKLNPTTSVTLSNSSDLTTKSDTKSFFTEGFWEKFESTVFLSMVNFKRGSNWNDKMKTVFNKFRKEINHANVLQFLGVTVIDSKIYFVNQHSSIRGTLHYVLRTCPFQINASIKMNIASDILEGLKYLHQRNIFHGSLNSLECYVDVAWCVKIAHWEVGTVHSMDEDDSHYTDLLTKANECETFLVSQETLIKLLYLDPDYFSNYGKPTSSMDVFSFGLLLVEIFTRKLPYAQEVELELNSYPDIVQGKFNSKQFSVPMNLADVPVRVLDLVHKTVTVSPRLMDINALHKAMKQMTGNKKSVVDILMQSMEEYMTELEEKVADRTVELFTVTNKMKDLLYDVLPKQIATKLINGQAVKPEFYECCTIFFSDIFGFSTISAASTPNQVMNFLNSLYTVFDQILERSDVYKVDTIGDVYMAASGTILSNNSHFYKPCRLSIGNLRQDA